jgi:hypothetical protein
MSLTEPRLSWFGRARKSESVQRSRTLTWAKRYPNIGRNGIRARAIFAPIIHRPFTAAETAATPDGGVF